MRITIGELTNELLPYSKIIDTRLVGTIPFTKAILGDMSGITMGYIYIAQVGEHKYSVADADNEMEGRLYIPTQSKINPLISEEEFARKWIGNNDAEEKDDMVTKNLDYVEFVKHFHQILLDHQMIKLTQKTLDTPVTSIGLSTLKLSKSLSCKSKEALVKDVLYSIKKSPMKLEGVKEKDVLEIVEKFKHLGVFLNTMEKTLLDFQLEKKNRWRGYTSGSIT